MSKNVWFEEEFREIKSLIKNKESLSHYDFLRIRNFKLQNSSNATDEEINKISKKAFELAKKDDIISCIKELVKLNGVQIPVASTILAMRFPDKFAIIDINVLRAMRKEELWSKYKTDPEIYKEYTLLLRKESKEKNKSMRELEFSYFLKGQNKNAN